VAIIGIFSLAGQPAAAERQYKIRGMGVHMHIAASSRSEVIASIPGGIVLAPAGECARNWCHVSFKGLTGWVFQAYLLDAASPLKSEAETRDQAPAPPPKAGTVNQVKLASPKAPAPRGAPAVQYRIEGLSADASLPIREKPSDTATILDKLLPEATGIEDLKQCDRQWCLVRHGEVTGFVQQRFLARTIKDGNLRYHVGASEDAIQVFDFPGQEAKVVGIIPFFASGIVPIGDCDANWCHVRYLGLVGWVSTPNLVSEEGANPAN
jgi:SH3-like domain-containing protein